MRFSPYDSRTERKMEGEQRQVCPPDLFRTTCWERVGGCVDKRKWWWWLQEGGRREGCSVGHISPVGDQLINLPLTFREAVSQRGGRGGGDQREEESVWLGGTRPEVHNMTTWVQILPVTFPKCHPPPYCTRHFFTIRKKNATVKNKILFRLKVLKTSP